MKGVREDSRGPAEARLFGDEFQAHALLPDMLLSRPKPLASPQSCLTSHHWRPRGSGHRDRRGPGVMAGVPENLVPFLPPVNSETRSSPVTWGLLSFLTCESGGLGQVTAKVFFCLEIICNNIH